MSQQPNKVERSDLREQPGKKNTFARLRLPVEAEKRAAKASGKRIQRGQGRITHPKTQQGNQYR